MQNLNRNPMSSHSSVPTDPLTILPLEILISIFLELSSGDRISCLGACRAWRDWMLRTPMVWVNVEATRSQEKAIYNLLPRVGQHIEYLDVKWHANRFMTSIAQGVFKNLKSLHVLCVKTPKVNHLERDLCLNALQKVGDTLTDLYIDFKLTPNPPTFTQIRLACPKLIKFGYHAMYFVRENMPTSHNIDTGKLIELSIGTNKAAMLGMDLENVLQYHPNIKKLTVTKFPYQYILNYIPRLCPNLESFTFSRNKDVSDQIYRFPVTLPIKALPTFQRKLHTLILMKDDFATPMPWDLLKSTLEQASPTLQQLHCCFHFTNTRFTKIVGANPPRFNFPELRILECTMGEGKSQKFVASFICNAPKLTAVAIRNFARSQRIGDQILDALIGLDNLTWLELMETSYSKQQLNEKKLIDLINKYAALKKNAPLQYVTLDGPFVSSTLLTALTKVMTLRGVELALCSPNLDKFITAVKKLNHFNDLRVVKMGNVTNETLVKLATIPNLKKFSVLGCKRVNDIGLFKLVDNSSSLEELTISKGTIRSYKFEAHAKKKLAKFAIEPHFDDFMY